MFDLFAILYFTQPLFHHSFTFLKVKLVYNEQKLNEVLLNTISHMHLPKQICIWLGYSLANDWKIGICFYGKLHLGNPHL